MKNDVYFQAYKCFYVLILTATYWITDAVHPSVAAMVPIALSSVMGSAGLSFISEVRYHLTSLLQHYNFINNAFIFFTVHFTSLLYNNSVYHL